jgi:hypothetical protein
MQTTPIANDIVDIKAQCLARRGVSPPQRKAGDSGVYMLHCKAYTYYTT